jgi:hypothetical protein
MVFAARHAHHRDDAGAAARGRQHLERLEAEPAMLHVVDGVLRAGIAQNLRNARDEELEDHRAGDGLARERALADGWCGQGLPPFR